VSVKTEIKYAHMRAQKKIHTHTHKKLTQCTWKGKGKEAIKKNQLLAAERNMMQNTDVWNKH